ncbi:MAG TPA: hypothetical protein VGD79_12120 [Thermoanaerobaculia bacterium]|jgi:hypothetical protein
MSLGIAKSLPPQRGPLLSVLYGALLDIESMRATMDELRHEMGPADAERFLLRLELLEGAAARLLEQIDVRGTVVSH